MIFIKDFNTQKNLYRMKILNNIIKFIRYLT